MTDPRKQARENARPAVDFHDPTAQGGYVPHRDNLVIAPERAYQSPQAVLADSRLSATQKRAVLVAWRDKEIRLANPPGGEGVDTGGDTLRAVEDSLKRLAG
mgnify:CR=1 FL=1